MNDKCDNCFQQISEVSRVRCNYCRAWCCDNCIDEHEDECEDIDPLDDFDDC